MAFMLGIKMVTYGLVGAAAIITHESTKSTKENFYKWVASKFTSQSPDPASPNSSEAGQDSVNKSDDSFKVETDADPFPFRAEQVKHEVPVLSPVNLTDNVAKSELIVLPSESAADGDLVPAGNAVSVQGERELPSQPSHSDADNAVNGDLLAESAELSRVAPDPAPATGIRGAATAAVNLTDNTVKCHLIVVPSEPAAEGDPVPAGNAVSVQGERVLPALSDADKAVDGDLLAESADQSRVAPDPAPPTGIRGVATAAVNAVRAWWRKQFQWVAGKFKRPAPDRAASCGYGKVRVEEPRNGVGDGESPPPTSCTLDPGVLEKVISFLTEILLLTIDAVFFEAFKRNKAALQVYRLVRRSWLW